MSVWRQEALSQSQNCCSYQQSTPAMLPKPYLKVMVPLVVQRLEDTAPQVRDAACEVLGTLLELLGDRPMVAYIVMPCRWPKKVFSSKIIFSFTRSHAEFRVKATDAVILSTMLLAPNMPQHIMVSAISTIGWKVPNHPHAVISCCLFMNKYFSSAGLATVMAMIWSMLCCKHSHIASV